MAPLPAVTARRAGALLALALLLAAGPPLVRSQGLIYDPQAVLAASAVQTSLNTLYAASKAWRRSYSKAAHIACSQQSGSLCASRLSVDEKSQLLLAASPQAFDSRNFALMGGFSAVGQVKDQGECNSCVSFAVLAAAQSAVACARRRPATSSMSEQDFLFCRTLEPGEERTCSSSWSMRAGVQAFIDLTRKNQYPVLEACMPYQPDNLACFYDCQDVEPSLKLGRFSYLQVQTLVDMQDYIRTWGSVVTRLDLWSDLKPFFKKDPNGVYQGHGKGASFLSGHAIQVIGYNNDAGWWLCSTSWGTEFADGGFFRVAYNASVGIGSPSDTFAIKFTLDEPLPRPDNRLVPSVFKSGCFDYKARPSDYVAKVASIFGIQIKQILLDNSDRITDPSMMLGGMTIILCGVVPAAPPSPARPAASPPPANSAAPSQQGTQPKAATPSAARPARSSAPPAAEEYDSLWDTPPPPSNPAPMPAPPAARARETPAAPPPAVVARAEPPAPPPQRVAQLKAGTYQGTFDCDLGQGAPAIIMVGQEASSGRATFAFFTKLSNIFVGECVYSIAGTCTAPAGADWCGGGGEGEAWTCRYEDFKEWADTCGGVRVLRSVSMEFCYKDGAIRIKKEKPTCLQAGGTLDYT